MISDDAVCSKSIHRSKYFRSILMRMLGTFSTFPAAYWPPTAAQGNLTPHTIFSKKSFWWDNLFVCPLLMLLAGLRGIAWQSLPGDCTIGLITVLPSKTTQQLVYSPKQSLFCSPLSPQRSAPITHISLPFSELFPQHVAAKTLFLRNRSTEAKG